MAKNSNCFAEFEKEASFFLNMCPKDDLKLLISNPKDKKIEDFGRFMCLGLNLV